jgi:hypothetical protein
MSAKRFSQKFKVLGAFTFILGLAVMTSGITSAVNCLAGLAVAVLGVYFFVDDWEKALAD